jgi:tetratricopeptide (TPR) repeat protein
MPKILNCLKKRDWLHDPQADSDQLVQYGLEYMNRGRLADALDFFEKANNAEGIRRIMEKSIEEGDPFLLQQTGKLLKEVIPEDAWRKVGEKALADGRFQQALMAFKAVRDEEQIEKIQTTLRA